MDSIFLYHLYTHEIRGDSPHMGYLNHSLPFHNQFHNLCLTSSSLLPTPSPLNSSTLERDVATPTLHLPLLAASTEQTVPLHTSTQLTHQQPLTQATARLKSHSHKHIHYIVDRSFKTPLPLPPALSSPGSCSFSFCYLLNS